MYCCQMRLQFIRETTEVSKEEKLYFDTKISALNNFSKTYQVGNRTYVVNIFFEIIFTMIDEKVANAVLNVTSSQRCNICLASPTQMNDIETICNKETNHITLLFGLSLI